MPKSSPISTQEGHTESPKQWPVEWTLKKYPKKWILNKRIPKKWIPKKWIPKTGIPKNGFRRQGFRKKGFRRQGFKKNKIEKCYSESQGYRKKWVPRQNRHNQNTSCSPMWFLDFSLASRLQLILPLWNWPEAFEFCVRFFCLSYMHGFGDVNLRFGCWKRPATSYCL